LEARDQFKETSMLREIGKLAVALLLAGVAGLSLQADADSCQPEPGTWQMGAYWRYNTSSQYNPVTGGRENKGDATFAVLGHTSWMGLEEWALAVFWKWVDGTRRVALFRYSGSPRFFVRWPLVADALAGAATTTSTSDLPLSLAMIPLTYTDQPVQVARESGAIDDEAVEGEQWQDGQNDGGLSGTTETVTLSPGDPGDAVIGGHTFLDAVPVDYTWSGRGIEHTGQALWSPELEWWVCATGFEEQQGTKVLAYTTELVEWGKLEPTELQQLLQSSLDGMAAAGSPSTDCLRDQLRALGFDLK
jgi:hypothetical protein